MNETDKDLIFSESVKAGKRIYYFDVKQSRNGDRYVAITESKKINEGTFENPRFVFEKHKLFLYKEDYEKFVETLLKTVEAAKSGVAPAPSADAAEAPAAQETVADAQPVEAAPQADAPAEKPEKKSFLDKVKDIF